VCITGLKHNGITLINYLIAQHPKAPGLGKISFYFDSNHMWSGNSAAFQ